MGIVNRDDALYWATGIDTSGLDLDRKHVERIFSEMAKGTGGSIREIRENLEESMQAQIAAIDKLESKLVEMKTAYADRNIKADDSKIIEQYQNEALAIEELTKEIGLQKKELLLKTLIYENLDVKMSDLRKTIDENIVAMIQMRNAGLENSQEFKELEEDTRVLSKALNQMAAEKRALASGGNFQGILSGLNGLSGVFSAGAGVLGLLNAKSEDYAKIQAKVQSMIAITIGLQQVQQTLYATSALRVQTLTKAKQLLNVVTKNLTRSQMIFLGVLTGGLLAGIVVVINAIEKLVTKQKEQRDEANKLSKAVANNSASQFANYERLRRSYNLLGDDIRAKEKFILDNQSAFDGLGVSIRRVNDADSIFIHNTQAFKKAIAERAKAAAAMELASEKYKEVILAQDNLDKTPKGYVTKNGTYVDGYGTKRKGKVLEKSKGWKNAEKDLDDKQKEFDKFISKNVYHTNKAAEIMRDAGIEAADDVKEGTKAFYEQIVRSNQQILDSMQSSEEGSKKWNETVAKIRHAQKMIKKFDVGDSNRNQGTTEDLSSGLREARLKMEAERLQTMKEGKEKRLKLSEQEWKEEIARIDKEHNERLKKFKDQGKAMTDEEVKIYEERKKIAGKAKNKRDADIEKELKSELENKYKELADVFLTEEQRKKKAIIERYNEERRQAKELLNGGGITFREYGDILSKIKASELKETHQYVLDGLNNLKQQEAEVTKYWNERISEIENSKILTEKERGTALIEARKRMNNEIYELNAHALTQSEEWVELFADTTSLTDKEIDNLIKSINEKINSGEFQLNPIDARNFIRSLEDVRDEMKSPINQIASSFKAWKTARENQAKAESELKVVKAVGAPDETIKTATNNVKKFKTEAQAAAAGVAKGFADARQLADAIGGAITDVTSSFGADTRQLENVTKLVGGVATAGQGIAKMASGDWVGGITDAEKGIADVIVSINGISDTERQKRIEKLAESVERAKKKYEELGYAREKAFSADKAKIIEEQNRLAEQQIRDLGAMIAEEDKKKNTDDDSIKQMREQQDELRRQIRENKDTAMSAIVGTDIMSAIDQFAQAYADAWASGENAAANSAKAIKNIIKGGLMEALKKDIDKDAQKVYKAIYDALADDNRISNAEQKYIDKLAEAMTNNADKYRKALEPYLDVDNQSGVTGELKAEMTEKTGSQLVGLWNMTAMDTRAIREYLEKNPINGFSKELNSILNYLGSIDRNTKDTANNTNGLKYELSEMNDKLNDIKNNTKPNSSRG